MKLNTFAPVMIMLGGLGLWACEDSAETAPAEEAKPSAEQPAAEAAKPETPPPPAVPTPAEVCTSIVEAAKAKDDAKIIGMSADGSSEAWAAEGAKDAMLAALGEITCGEATVAEDGTSATVKATAPTGEREIPFVKAGDAWKLNTTTYLEKNPLATDAGKKGKKGKKGAKKAGKKKGKK